MWEQVAVILIAQVIITGGAQYFSTRRIVNEIQRDMAALSEKVNAASKSATRAHVRIDHLQFTPTPGARP